MKIASVLAIAMTTGALLHAADDVVDKRIRDAADVFREIMDAPDKGIPKALLDKAHCVLIVPGMKKAAIGIGGVYGRGFATCRRSDGGWGPPAAIRLVGGSFGLQLGVESTDVVMLVMNESGFRRLLTDKFTLGADASAAAGPVGRYTAAETDAMMTAEILSWSRAHGVFAGVSLNGTVVESDKSENEKLYGKPLSSKEIIEEKIAIPPAARQLISVLEKYSS
jgi:lipid-binding SYLF domain-containing protein